METHNTMICTPGASDGSRKRSFIAEDVPSVILARTKFSTERQQVHALPKNNWSSNVGDSALFPDCKTLISLYENVNCFWITSGHERPTCHHTCGLCEHGSPTVRRCKPIRASCESAFATNRRGLHQLTSAAPV